MQRVQKFLEFNIDQAKLAWRDPSVVERLARIITMAFNLEPACIRDTLIHKQEKVVALDELLRVLLEVPDNPEFSKNSYV